MRMQSPVETKIQANGLTFNVEERGPSDGPAIVLIMGFAGQMTLWPEPLLDELAGKGFRVIRFDNRDIGLSDEVKPTLKLNTRVAFLRYKLGQRFKANYTLYDMADDTVGILDALGIEQAHIVGASMGGMIAQIMAAKHSTRVASLSLIMTTNNSPKQPLPSLKIIKEFMMIGTGKGDPQIAIERSFRMWKAFQSPAYPKDDATVREFILENHERSYRPGGIVRQLHAILATGSLQGLLKKIETPTVVIHGEDDPLLPPKNGRVLAKYIRGAKHVPVAGMGHDLPEDLLVFFSDLIFRNSLKAEASA